MRPLHNKSLTQIIGKIIAASHLPFQGMLLRKCSKTAVALSGFLRFSGSRSVWSKTWPQYKHILRLTGQTSQWTKTKLTFLVDRLKAGCDTSFHIAFVTISDYEE